MKDGHPYIVKVYEVWKTEDHIFIVMDYCEGGTLLEYLTVNKALNESEASQIMRKVVYALNYYNQQFKVVHGDLNLESFMF